MPKLSKLNRKIGNKIDKSINIKALLFVPWNIEEFCAQFAKLKCQYLKAALSSATLMISLIACADKTLPPHLSRTPLAK